jgi:hypothetical protein
VDDADQFERAALELLLDRGGVGGPAPLLLEDHDLGALALGHLADPVAEVAVHARQHPVAGLDQVDDRRLHARRPGSGGRVGHRIRGAEQDL